MDDKQMRRNADAVELESYVNDFLNSYKENEFNSGVLIYTKNLEKNKEGVITKIGDLNIAQIGYPSINKDLSLRYIIEDTKRQIEDSVNNGALTEDEGKDLFKSIGLMCAKTIIDGFLLTDSKLDLNQLKRDYDEIIVK